MNKKLIEIDVRSLLEKEDRLVDDSFPTILKMMEEQFLYHQKQIEKHEKQIEEIKFLMDMYESRYNMVASTTILEDLDLPKYAPYGHSLHVPALDAPSKYYGGGDTLFSDSISYYSKIKKNLSSLILPQSNTDKRGKSFWRSMAIIVIETTNQLTRSVEILNFPGLDMDKEERRIEMIVLSGCLSELCEMKVIQKIDIPGKKGFYYGLSYMFDNNGTPKRKYLNINDY